MTLRTLAAGWAFVALAAAAGPRARADLVVGNLNLAGNPANGQAIAYQFGQGFNTGNLSTPLDSVSVSMAEQPGNNVTGITATLYAGDASGPSGNPLVTLDQASPLTTSPTYSVVKLLPTSTFTLAANTDYWFEFDSTNATFESGVEFTSIQTSYGPGSFLGDERNGKVNVSSNMIIQINSSSVPEPSGLLLLGTLVAGAVGFARRRACGGGKPARGVFSPAS